MKCFSPPVLVFLSFNTESSWGSCDYPDLRMPLVASPRYTIEAKNSELKNRHSYESSLPLIVECKKAVTEGQFSLTFWTAPWNLTNVI